MRPIKPQSTQEQGQALPVGRAAVRCSRAVGPETEHLPQKQRGPHPDRPDSKEQLLRIHLYRVVLQRVANPVNSSGVALGSFARSSILYRSALISFGVLDHHHARLQAAQRVLRDHDSDLPCVQRDRGADRIYADHMNELLHQGGLEQAAASLVDDVERIRGRHVLAVRSGATSVSNASAIAAIHPGKSDRHAAQTARIAGAVEIFVVQRREPRKFVRQALCLAQDLHRVIYVRLVQGCFFRGERLPLSSSALGSLSLPASCNRPKQPELLDALARQLQESGRRYSSSPIR